MNFENSINRVIVVRTNKTPYNRSFIIKEIFIALEFGSKSFLVKK